MKQGLLLIFLYVSIFSFAQNNDKNIDSLFNEGSNEFIENHKDQLNIKFDVSNDLQNYFISTTDRKVNIRPNLNLRYALDFNYKFASVRLGIRAPISDSQKEDKGNSYVFRFKIKLLFNKWSHQFEYNYVRGYYIENSNELTIEDAQYKVQLPQLKTYVLSGSSGYKFNNKFSLRAVASQTEIQLKSAGSFIPSLNYWFYKIDDTNKLINTSGEVIERDSYNNYNGFSTVLNMGYYYTFVFKKYWYAHAYAAPGIGIDFYKIKTHTIEQNFDRNYKNLILSIQSGIALGYNAQKYYFGILYNNNSNIESQYKEDFQFQTSRNVFHVFVGYRFKTPKLIKKPIDQMEDNIPLLQNKNQN